MGMPDNIVKVEKVDPMTVRFQLKNVDASFLADLAMSFASIQSAEYADKLLKEGHPEQINSQPIGTGPFIFKRYQKDAQIRFAGNKEYWDKGANGVKLDNLIFAITTDPSVRMQKLKTNECQVAAYPRPADVAEMKTDPKLHMLTQSGFNVGYLGYNVLHKPLNQLVVRQALDMSINKPAILQAVYQGQGQPAVNPMPPTQWSYNHSVKDAPFNPSKAKALLAKAGFPNGFDITLWAMPVQRPYNPNAKLMAEMIQSDWAKIGVRAKIVTYEWGEYLKRAKGGEHDAILVGWTGDNGDPDNWLNALLGCEAVNGNNYTKWCYKPFDDLIQQGKRMSNVAARSKLYMKAQVIAKQQLPLTTIAHSTVNEPTTKNVVGFKVSPFGLNSFYGVSVK
jgi:dipeptide transport system substrate-binding protein